MGNGRPFAFQCLNPRKIRLSDEDVLRVEKEINSSTKDVNVHSLKIVTQNQFHDLKQGEETKRKTYTALCFTKKPIPEEILWKLTEFSDLEVSQATPVRVMHRRPLANRIRLIHSMKPFPIDSYHFRLQMTTQAGTYIKEFVHGDFGRTKPSLRDILGQDYEVDILELDVENVELEWP